jgi:hypothetical protein
MVRKIVADNVIDSKHLLGTFLDESHYDILIEEDCDVYTPAGCDLATTVECKPQSNCADCPKGIDENRVAFVFRKNFFSKEQQQEAYEGLRAAATPTNNRGTAAGTVRTGKNGNREWVTEYEEAVIKYFAKPYNTITGDDPLDELEAKKSTMTGPGLMNTVWRTGAPIVFADWVEATRKLPTDKQKVAASYIIENNISATTYANEVFSGIAGAFGRTPRVPHGRLAAYNDHNPEMFEKGVPFLQTLDRAFAELLPKRHTAQKEFVDSLDEHFRIADTVFTTLTINKTFRTAAHLDAGDYGPGFSNLLVLSNDSNFTGGYLILPEVRIAVNVRPGDLLLIANHTAIHGNTPIVLGSESSERISVVAYAREDLATLGTWDYEQTRKKYVESCKDNKDHPHWWERFNGVWAGMWVSREWYDYLVNAMGEDVARANDPGIFALHNNDSTDLESFFS